MLETGPAIEPGSIPLPGEVIDGKYQVVRQIGAGGMGAVVEAVHLEIGSRAAVKFLHPRYAEDVDALERFQREARAAAAIGHDAIIGVHDIGCTERGLPYLVMELLRGQPLAALLDDGGAGRQLDVPLTAYVACQVLSGLAAAHEAGIVHRDLKPDNIFLVETGALVPSVKILDFGISKVLTQGQRRFDRSPLTQTGTVLGTPEYMSPEQARGALDLDHRTDLFSLGVILYECLTGRGPFSGSNYNAVMAAILQDDPEPPGRLRPDLEPRLEAVVRRALVKDRGGRFQTAAEMFAELIDFVDDKAVGRIPFPKESFEVGDVSSLQRFTDDVGEPTAVDGQRPDAVTRPLGAAADTDAPTVVRPDPRGRRRAPRVLVLGILIGLVLVGAGLGAAVGLSMIDAEPEPVAPGPAPAIRAEPEPAVAPSPPPAEPELVEIGLGGLPEKGAKVYLDGALVEAPLKLPRGSAKRELTVVADGYEPVTIEVVPRSSTTIQVVLGTPRPKTRPAKAGQPRTPVGSPTKDSGYFEVPQKRSPYLGE